MTRERLLGLFWPDSSDERARNTLKQTLYALRRDLDEGELLLGTQDLYVNPERLTSDVAEFEQAVRAGDHAAAVSVYGGPFLDGVNPGGSTDLDQWVDAHRARFATMFAASAEQAAAAAADAGDRHGAVLIWRKLAAQDPYSGRAALGLMRALAAGGDPASAMQHARVYETLVRNELGAEPDAAVTHLVGTLRLGAPPEARPVVALSRPAAASSERARTEAPAVSSAALPPAGAVPARPDADPEAGSSAVPAAPVLGLVRRNAAEEAGIAPAAIARPSRRTTRRRAALLGGMAVLGIIGASGMLSGSRIAYGAAPALHDQRYAVLPCGSDGELSPAEELTPAECELLFHDALQGWADVDLADELRLRDAVTRTPGLSIDARLAVARDLGARYAVVPSIRPGVGVPIVRAALYDVSTGRLLNRAAATIETSPAEAGPAMRSLVAELLGGGRSSDSETPLGTPSLAAWQRFSEGRAALADWRLAVAREALEAAVVADSGYAPARYWLAQVEHWVGDRPRAERQVLAGRAAATADRLSPRDRARALALHDLLSARYQEACVRYDSLVAADSLDVVGWLGRGDCNAQDDLVVPDARAAGGFRFRGSYQAAIQSYERVLATVPTAARMFEGERFERLMSLFYVDPVRVRRGRAAADAAIYVGFPERIGDSLAFVPVDVSNGRAISNGEIPASRHAAIMVNRRRFAELMARWSSLDAENPRAHEGQALALEALGELKSGTVAGSAALAALELAELHGREDSPAEIFRLSIIDIRMRLKAGQYAEVRTRGEALLRAAPPDGLTQRRELAAVAALLGRVDAALALTATSGSPGFVTQQRSFGVTVSPRVEEVAGILPLLVTVPGYEQLLASALAELEGLLRTELGGADRDRLYPALIGEAAHYGLMRMPASVLPYYPAGAPVGDRLLAAQLDLRRGNSAGATEKFAEMLATLDGSPLDGMLVNESLSLAAIALAVGDSASAERLVSNAVIAIPAIARRASYEPHRMIAIPLLLLQQERLASARGDRVTSQRVRQQLQTLWATADQPLRRAVGLQ